MQDFYGKAPERGEDPTLDAMLEQIENEIHNSVLMANPQRISEVKRACDLLAEAVMLDNPEAKISVTKDKLTGRNLVFHAEGISLGITDMKSYLAGMQIAANVCYSGLPNGNVEMDVTFDRCYVHIGSI